MALTKAISELNTDWKHIFPTNEVKKIDDFLQTQINIYSDIEPTYPPASLLLNAFNQFNISDLRIVLLGQDPYINEGEAMGLSFSVPNGCKMPPSLRNIYKELYNDLKITRTSTDLSDWAKQGILLLNTSLSVRKSKSHSHKKIWKTFTNEIISYISNNCNKIIFVLWGNPAKEKSKLIDTNKHYIIKGVHPSPLSANRGFFGSKPFSKINTLLDVPIKWN